jgi:hypothetical protein
MNHLTEINIHRGMVGTQEMTDAIDHNARVEIVDIINIALKEALQIGHVPTCRTLTRLKGAAMKEDFQDYDGEHYDAQEHYENCVCSIMEDLENNFDG